METFGLSVRTHWGSQSGKSIAEIINDAGEIVLSRNFGEMTENEFRGILNVIKQEYPDLGADAPIELTENKVPHCTAA